MRPAVQPGLRGTALYSLRLTGIAHTTSYGLAVWAGVFLSVLHTKIDWRNKSEKLAIIFQRKRNFLQTG